MIKNIAEPLLLESDSHMADFYGMGCKGAYNLNTKFIWFDVSVVTVCSLTVFYKWNNTRINDMDEAK